MSFRGPICRAVRHSAARFVGPFVIQECRQSGRPSLEDAQLWPPASSPGASKDAREEARACPGGTRLAPGRLPRGWTKQPRQLKIVGVFDRLASFVSAYFFLGRAPDSPPVILFRPARSDDAARRVRQSKPCFAGSEAERMFGFFVIHRLRAQRTGQPPPPCLNSFVRTSA